MKNSMFRNEHGRSFLNDAVRGGRGTAGIKPSARIKKEAIAFHWKRALLGFFQGQRHAVRDEFPAAVGAPNGRKLQCAYTAVLR